MWESALFDISRKAALQQQKMAHKVTASNLIPTTQNELSNTELRKLSQKEIEIKQHTQFEPLISQRISQRLPELHKQLEHASEAREQNIQWDKLIRSDEAFTSTMAELEFQHHLTQESTFSVTEESITLLQQEHEQHNQITSSQNIIREALHYPFALCAEVVCTLLKAGKIDDAVMLIHNWNVPIINSNIHKANELSHALEKEKEFLMEEQERRRRNKNVFVSAHTRSRVVLEFVHVLNELRSLNDVVTLRALMEILEAAYKEQYVQNSIRWHSVALVYSPSAQIRLRTRTLQHKLFAPLEFTQMEMLYYKAIETLCTLPTNGTHTCNLQTNSTSHNIKLVEKLTWLNRAIHVEEQLKTSNNCNKNNVHNPNNKNMTFFHHHHHHHHYNSDYNNITLPYSLQRAIYTHIESDPNYHHELAMSVCPLLPHVCSSQLITSTGAELVCLSTPELKRLWNVYHTDLAHNTTTTWLSTSSSYSSQSSFGSSRCRRPLLAHVHSWTDILFFLRHRSRPIQEVTLKLHFIDQLLSAPTKKYKKCKHRLHDENNSGDVKVNNMPSAVCTNESSNHQGNSVDVMENNEELSQFYKEIASSITSELYSAQIASRRRMCWHVLSHPQRHFLLHKVLHLSLLDVFAIYALTFRTVHRTSRRFAKACLLTVKHLCMKQEYERAARIAWNHLSLECTINAQLLASHPSLADYVVVAMCRSIHLSVIHGDSSSRSAKLTLAPETSLLVLSPWMGHRTLAFLRLLHMAHTLTPMQCIPLCTCALNCGLHFQHINDLIDFVFDIPHNVKDNEKQNKENSLYSSNDNELRCWTADMIRVCAAHHEIQQASWPLYSSSSSTSPSSRKVYCTEWQRLMNSLYRFFPSRRQKCNESNTWNRHINHQYSYDDHSDEFTTDVDIRSNRSNSSAFPIKKQFIGKERIAIDVPNRSRQQALWSLLYDKPTSSRHHVLKSLILSLYLDEEVRNSFIMCDGWLPEPSSLSSSTSTTSMTKEDQIGAPSSKTSSLSSSAISSPSMQALQQAHSLLNYETAASLASSCYSYHTYKTFIEGLRAKAAQWRSAHTASSHTRHETHSSSISDEAHNCAEICKSSTHINCCNNANISNYAHDRLHHLLISELDQLECSNKINNIVNGITCVRNEHDDSVQLENIKVEESQETFYFGELQEHQQEEEEEENKSDCEYSTTHIIAKKMVTHVEDHYQLQKEEQQQETQLPE